MPPDALALYATVILVVAVVAGQIILDAIGIRMHSLKVAGGIILFLFALKMLFGGLDSKPGSPEAGRDLAVFPMAVPSIAGPGAIMAVIVLTDNDVYTVPEQAETGVVPGSAVDHVHFPAFFRFHLAGHRAAGRSCPRPSDGNYSRFAGRGNCADSPGGGRLEAGESTESLTWLDSGGGTRADP